MTRAMTSSAREYLKELGVLRASMRANASDDAAAAKGITLRYFVDANIVAAYLDPASRLVYFPPLETWIEDEDLRLATVTLLLEFLFSGHLHGQNGQPVFITPSHFQEVGNMAQAIASKGRRNIPTNGARDDKIRTEIANYQNRRERAKQEVDALHRDLQRKTIDAAGAVEKLYRAVPLLVGSPSEDTRAYEQLALIERLVVEERLVHAETSSWFHSGLFTPDRTLLRWLTDRLREIRRKKKNLKESTLFADAVSLLQVMMLETECPPDVKYIFITADDSIGQLYDEYRTNETKAERNPMVLNLRRPRDFVALINVQSMSSTAPAPHVTGLPKEQIQQERVSVFEKIKTASGVSPMNGDIGDWHIHRTELLDLWRRATGYSVLLYVNLLAARERTLNATLQQVLAQGNVYQALLLELSKTVNTIGIRHAVAAIQSGGPRRAPLLFRRKLFHEFIDDEPIDEYLDRLAGNKVGVNYEKLTAPNKENEALLFLACVAIAARQWDWARQVAERAFTAFENAQGPDRSFEFEARFCLAMAMRFTMHSESDFNKAHQLLTACIHEHRAAAAQSFRLLRAESESAALIGTYLYSQLWNSREIQQLRPERMADLTDDWLRHIDCAKAVADERLTKKIEAGSRGVDTRELRIWLQVFSNRASAAVFEAAVLRRNMHQLQESLRFDFKEFSSTIDQYKDARRAKNEDDGLPNSVTIPAAMLAVIVAEDAQKKQAAVAEAEAQLSAALDGGQSIPEMDRNEFRLFRKYLPLI